MKRGTHIFIALGIIAGMAYSCKPKETTVEVTAGEVDATRFVAIGGSLTAGFMDDALYAEGQQNSLAGILSTQLELIEGSKINHPLMPLSSSGCNTEGLSRLILGYKTDCQGVSSLSPVRETTIGDVANFLLNTYSSGNTFSNFGIPFIKSTQLAVAGFGNAANGPGNYSPYFERMSSDQANASVKSDVLALNPTFFSLFVGMDEVMEYTRKGATGLLTPVNGSAGVGFDGSMEDMIQALTAGGARGVIANVPNVQEFPFFTTIPYDGLNLDAQKVEDLNLIYNPIGIFFHEGKNPFVIEDPSAGTFGVRFMEPGERVLLSVPLDSVKCFKMGSVYPFRNEFILTNDEIAAIQARIDGYNDVISGLADSYNLAHVDVQSFFNGLSSGIIYNGVSLNASFVSGGAFSLDGRNLNPRGNALLANEFIKAINKKYNSTIPAVDATKYRGIVFP
jgi:hypothetical protein